jgi:tetratricopeptide (TPR) repeat protein
MMCLDVQSRYLLALALQERNLRNETREQWQLLQQTGNPEDPYVTVANQYLGNLLVEKEPLAAANHWDQLRFHVLKPTTNLTEQAGYLDIALSLHRARARGSLAQGDQAAALKLLTQCEALQPGEIKLVEEFVPLLRKAGLEKEADKLFENCFHVYQQLVKEYPDSANLHNQAAWVAAISVRRLDEALLLAERAVQLAPDSPSYLDTLAEVHFARGNRELALEWARKSAVLDPGSKFYEDRLQSFAKRDLPPR